MAEAAVWVADAFSDEGCIRQRIKYESDTGWYIRVTKYYFRYVGGGGHTGIGSSDHGFVRGQGAFTWVIKYSYWVDGFF